MYLSEVEQESVAAWHMLHRPPLTRAVCIETAVGGRGIWGQHASLEHLGILGLTEAIDVSQSHQIAWLASLLDWSCPSQHAIHIVPVVVHRVHASPDAYTSVNNCTAVENLICVCSVTMCLFLCGIPVCGFYRIPYNVLTSIDHTFKLCGRWPVAHYRHDLIAVCPVYMGRLRES
jgi:hypothetical protein